LGKTTKTAMGITGIGEGNLDKPRPSLGQQPHLVF
jgi:hypothetical protein